MFVAYEVSKELITFIRPIVEKIERRDSALADQLRRAASSVPLNLNEGAQSLKGNKHKHYSIAHGSAAEVRAALEVAVAWGWIELPPETAQMLDRLMRLLWGLTHPK